MMYKKTTQSNKKTSHKVEEANIQKKKNSPKNCKLGKVLDLISDTRRHMSRRVCDSIHL